MVKLGLDISTIATGIVLQKNNERPTMLATIFAADKITANRIKTMVVKIFDCMERTKFDIAIITKAKTRFVEPNVALIEGAVFGKCIIMNKKINYYPDSAWYSKFGSMKDKRHTKKLNSVLRFIKRTSLQPEVLKLEKLKVGNKITRINIMLRNGKVITDDVADAYNAVDLYERRMVDYQIKNDEEKFKKEIKRLKRRLLTNKQRAKNTREHIAKITGLKTTDMKIAKRKMQRQLKRADDNIKKYTRAIYDLEREHKNNAKQKKL